MYTYFMLTNLILFLSIYANVNAVYVDIFDNTKCSFDYCLNPNNNFIFIEKNPIARYFINNNKWNEMFFLTCTINTILPILLYNINPNYSFIYCNIINITELIAISISKKTPGNNYYFEFPLYIRSF